MKPATWAPTSSKGLAALERESEWPPHDVGDEPWVAFDRPWMHGIPGAPKTFYVTSLAPDPQRKAKVQIVAIDARQIELDMAIGAEGPYPPDEKTAGKWPRTGGKLPRDPAIAPRVVAAFNGAFRLDQNAHGMIIRGRTFAPPVHDVATLFMHDDGRLGFGTFRTSDVVPPDVRSLRQNLEPLFADGVFNPLGRKRWGGILPGKNQVGQRAMRSGICRTSTGNLLYLWGSAIEATDLAAAMKRAGCEYGMHLDMNVHHVGFVFMSFDDAQYKSGKSEALSTAMGITDKRYVQQPSPKEFFYATLRAPLEGFSADGFAQPPPAWLPAIVTRAVDGARITRIEGRRTSFATTGPALGLNAPALAGTSLDRILAAVDFGPHPRTLLEGGKSVDAGDDVRIAAGLTAHGDLVVVEADGEIVEALRREGCVRAVGSNAGSFQRAGRDEIPSGGAGARLYVVAEAMQATYRFDR